MSSHLPTVYLQWMKEGSQRGVHRVGIFVFNGADELDVVGPYRVLSAVNDVTGDQSSGGLEVKLVAEDASPVTLGNGLRIIPDDDLVSASDLEVLLLPGGSSQSQTAGRRVEQRNRVVIDFIKRTAETANLVGSVCTGAFLLAEAGLLAGRRANTHWLYRDELEEMMSARGEAVEIVAERVVWDGNVVTGGGVTSGIDIALELVERLFSESLRLAIARALELETPPLSVRAGSSAS
jgi:transcriptional regulator GlxA family with amidase domain